VRLEQRSETPPLLTSCLCHPLTSFATMTNDLTTVMSGKREIVCGIRQLSLGGAR
jgi:hypothetical protein